MLSKTRCVNSNDALMLHAVIRYFLKLRLFVGQLSEGARCNIRDDLLAIALFTHFPPTVQDIFPYRLNHFPVHI